MKRVVNFSLSRVNHPKFLLALLLIFVGFAGCSGKRPHPGTPPALPPGERPETPKNPVPGDPTARLEPPSPYSPVAPLEAPKKEVPSIALVLGGAGVASFATVGLLKRFHEEGIKFDFIITTGWPTLFALGNGFLHSVHDLEWFAMRLQEKDFYSVGSLEKAEDLTDHGRISPLIQNSFQSKAINQGQVPLYIAATNTDLGSPETYEGGDWRTPLLKTMSIPGLYRPYPEGDGTAANGLIGMDVDEAFRRGAKVVIAVEMYDDYFAFVRKSRKATGDRPFRKAYVTRLQGELGFQMRKATVSGRIVLNKDPQVLAAKRSAIVQGYKEGTRLARQLRSILSKAPTPPDVDLSAKAE